MIGSLGLGSEEDLFRTIPGNLLDPKISFPEGLAESDLIEAMEQLASENKGAVLKCFAGGGCYDHHVPAAVGDLISRGEFLTSYTPYQPEISQGMLQVIYEFQTLVCRLSGLEASNASLYDGASAVWESVSMAVRSDPRAEAPRVLVDGALHPHISAHLKSMGTRAGWIVESLPLIDGALDLDSVSGKASALVVASPNFFGRVIDLRPAAERIHSMGGLLVAFFRPSAMGLLESPGAMGADLAAAEGQGFGIPMQFGGPNLGLIASKKNLLRKMPGRISGRTRDASGSCGYVLTLQAREQHIRRERSTSSVCTNQALCALAFLIHMSLLGPSGLRNLGRTILSRGEWLKKEIQSISGFSILHQGPTFQDFVVHCDKPVVQVMQSLEDAGVLGGIPLEGRMEGYDEALLVSVTEKRTPKDLELYVDTLRKI